MEALGVLLLICYLVLPWLAFGLVLHARSRNRRLQITLEDIRQRVEQLERAAERPSPSSVPPPPLPEAAAIPVPQPSNVVHTASGTASAHAQAEDPPTFATKAEAPETEEAPKEKRAHAPRWDRAKFARFLQRIGMWPPPPTEGVSREAQIMQWVLPRIGGVLALMATVFFGVYVGQQAAPGLRLSALLALSIGVLAAGEWTIRRAQAVGPVLFATGWLMLYTAAAGAYYFSPIKVIESETLALLVQGGVTLAMASAGLARRSLTVGHFAIFLTYALAAVIAMEDQALLAVSTGIVGAITALAYAARLRTGAPLWLMGVSQFVFLGSWAILARAEMAPLPGAIALLLHQHLPALAALLLGATIDWGQRARKVLIPALWALQMGAGVLFWRWSAFSELEMFAGVSALVVACTALVGWRTPLPRTWLAPLLIQASVLASVWVAVAFLGPLRWVVLSLQALGIAVAFTRHPRTWKLVLLLGTTAASCYYVGIYPWDSPVFWSERLALLLQPILFGFTLALPLQTMEQGPKHTPEALLRLTKGRSTDVTNRWLFLTFALGYIWIAGLGLNAIPQVLIPAQEHPWPWLALSAVGLLAIALRAGSSRWWAWQSVLTGGIGLLVYLNAPTGIVFPTTGLMMALGGAWWHAHRVGKPAPSVASIPLAGLVAVAFMFWLREREGLVAIEGVLLTGLAVIFALLGRLKPFRALVTASAVLFLPFLSDSPPTQSSLTWGLNLALLLGWLAVLDDKDWRASLTDANAPRTQQLLRVLQFSWLALLPLAFLVGTPWVTLDWTITQLALTFAASGLFALFLVRGNVEGLAFAGGSAALAWGRQIGLLDGSATLFGETAPITTSAWAASAVGTVLALLLLARTKRQFPHNRLGNATSLLVGIGVWSSAAATLTFGGLNELLYYTPLLASVSVGLIIWGLWQDDRWLRRFALVSLLVPGGRLFFVDLEEPLTRIIAFGVGAVLLVGLGWLYQRFAKHQR